MVDFVLKRKNVIFTVFLCLSVFGVITQVNGQSNNEPSWIDDKPSDDEIWGIGVAKLVNSRNSMNLAELSARSHIVRQLYSKVIERENDDEFNNLFLFFMMYISTEASFEIINDTKVLKTWVAPDGTSWCLITMRKSESRKYLSIIENIYREYYDEFIKK